jgi:hypothetical protein
MTHRWIGLLLAAAAAVALPDAAAAQHGPQPPARARSVQGLQQPQLRDDEQISPSQIATPPPAAPRSAPAGTPAAAAKPAKPPEPGRSVACSGTFAKDSGHLRLAQAFGAQNLDFTQVDGADGSTMMASVLFPQDPKRRLEIMWDDDQARAGTRLIVIAGQSTWVGPKGLRIGMPLAALEKLNGKPIKITGFDKTGEALVSDWNGGTLTFLPDGCRLGIQLKVDPKATEEARGAVMNANKEFLSTDAAVRAVKPAVDEVILAYRTD